MHPRLATVAGNLEQTRPHTRAANQVSAAGQQVQRDNERGAAATLWQSTLRCQRRCRDGCFPHLSVATPACLSLWPGPSPFLEAAVVYSPTSFLVVTGTSRILVSTSRPTRSGASPFCTPFSPSFPGLLDKSRPTGEATPRRKVVSGACCQLVHSDMVTRALRRLRPALAIGTSAAVATAVMYGIMELRATARAWPISASKQQPQQPSLPLGFLRFIVTIWRRKVSQADLERGTLKFNAYHFVWLLWILLVR